MKIFRLIVGILCLVFSPLSCCVSLGELAQESLNIVLYSATQILVGVLMIIGGVTAICTRKSDIGSIITGIIFSMIAVLCFLVWNPNDTTLIPFYGFTFAILAMIFIITGIVMKIINKKAPLREQG